MTRRILLLLFWFLTGRVHGVAQPAPGEELLTDSEIAAMDRENGMWRLANPDQGLAANITRLKQAGYSDEEIAALQPRLAAMWTVPFERNFGWLRPDAVERIRAVDHEFVGRMRAAQLYDRTGVRTGTGGQETTAAVNHQWRVAILQALTNDELVEFQLMNSTAARQESRLTRGLALTGDEQRTLFEWRRDYDGRHGSPLSTESGLSAWQRELLLDQCRRLRDLLGDARFAVYLSRINPGFERMRIALDRGGEVKPATALELWWLRQKDYPEIDSQRGVTVPGRAALLARLQERVAGILGEAKLKAYLEDTDGRWLAAAQHRRSAAAVLPSAHPAEPARAP
jgi:hypothetical protein